MPDEWRVFRDANVRWLEINKKMASYNRKMSPFSQCRRA